MTTADESRAAEDEGGDPACWMHLVCPVCGSMADEDPPRRCARCGEEFPVPPG